MNPYNENTPCLKCGKQGAITRLIKVARPFAPDRDNSIEENQEVLERICRQCGFVWNELPLDSPDAKPESIDEEVEKILEQEIKEDDYQMTEKGFEPE